MQIIMVSLLPKNQRVFWLSLFGFCSILYMVVTLNKFKPASVPIYPPPDVEMIELCGEKVVSSQWEDGPVYLITPTYTRREQIAELTRLGQTLKLAGNIHWILAEDAGHCSSMVSALLERLNISYSHLLSPQPAMYRAAKLRYNPRGVSSRRAGLHWLLNRTWQGVVYFGDDDNTYDTRLFQQISRTSRVSMFPVGFIGRQGVSSPIVKEGKVIGFSDDWFAGRQFPVDMAGFAINVQFLRKRNPSADTAMPYKAGYEEDLFLQSLNLTLEEIEPLAGDCSEVLVWHTKTLKDKTAKLRPLQGFEDQTNLQSLQTFLIDTGIAELGGTTGQTLRKCYSLEKCKTQKS